MQNLEKEAQLYTKMKEKINPSGSRAVRLSPIRWLGKKLLRSRSPEVYGKAIDVVEKVDDLLRETVSRQNILLAEMRKFKKGVSTINFALSAKRFVKEQKLINKATEKLELIFKDIAGQYGNIDVAINASIGGTPEISSHLENKEVDEESYLENQLDKISSLYMELSKEALLGGRYWRTRTESGRAFAEKFTTIYRSFEGIWKHNIDTLKKLDELRSIGDPGKYLQKAKDKYGFAKIEKVLKNSKINDAWQLFETIAVQEPTNIQEKPPAAMVPKPPAVPAPVSVPEEAIENKPAVLETPVPAFAKPPIQKEPEATEGEEDVLGPDDIKSDEADAANDNKNDINGNKKDAMNHDKFINKLNKKANRGDSSQDLVQFILRYANKIDGIDTDYALKLTAIAEGLADE